MNFVFSEMRYDSRKRRVRPIRWIAALIGMGLVFFLSGFSFSEDGVVESRWTASPPKVDGLAVEWPSDFLYFEKGVNVGYAFRNDGRNLYILFMLRNPLSSSSIEGGGMTIYFRTDGKKKKGFGIRFIKRTVTADQFIMTLEKRGQLLTEGNKVELLTQPNYTLLEADAVDKNGKVISPPGPRVEVELPAFNVTKQGDIMTYEFRIPLSSRELYPAGIVAEPGKNIEVGFEWARMTKGMERAMSTRPEPRGQTGFGGSPDWFGDTPAQQQLRAFDSVASPYRSGAKKPFFWVSVKLALNQ